MEWVDNTGYGFISRMHQKAHFKGLIDPIGTRQVGVMFTV